jgi:hypothetical protein
MTNRQKEKTMATETVMMRVCEEDKARLKELYGGPTHEAFHKVMTVTAPNPELAAMFLAAVKAWKDKQEPEQSLNTKGTKVTKEVQNQEQSLAGGG